MRSKFKISRRGFVSFWIAALAAWAAVSTWIEVGWILPQSAAAPAWPIFGVHFVAGALALVPLLWRQQNGRRRLSHLHLAVKALATGDDIPPVNWKGKDEIARISAEIHEISLFHIAMTDHATRMSQGNLLKDPAPRSDVDQLGEALRALASKLRLMVGALETNCLTVSKSARSVADGVTAAVHAVSALSEWMTALSMTAKSASGDNLFLAEAVEEQSTALHAAIEAMSLLNGEIHRVSEGAQEQDGLAVSVGVEMQMASDMVDHAGSAALSLANQAGHASKTAAEGSASVTDALRLLQQVRDSVGEGSKRVTDLVHVSGCIREVVLSIEEIARQTNLLSLNAAIEAARAGEHGHGFSVVAEEIRRLADRTAALTREIADLLHSVSEAGEHAVAAMETGRTEVEAVAQAGERAGSSLHAILTTVQSTAEYAGTVNGAVGSMSNAVKSARESVDRMLDLARQNGGAASSMATAVEQFTVLLERVQIAAGQIDTRARAARQITAEVAQSADTLSSALQEQSRHLGVANNLTDGLMASTLESEHLLGRFQFQWDRRKGETDPPKDKDGNPIVRTMTIQQAALKAWGAPSASEAEGAKEDEQRAA